MKALAAAAAVVVSSLAASASAAPASAPDCLAVVVRSDLRSGLWRRPADFFAREIQDVNVRVLFPPGSAPDAVEVRFLNPNEHLYQTMSVPVAADGNARALPDHPWPVRSAQPVPQKRFGWRVVAIDVPGLPVAGTHIVTNSLYGKWTVEARAVGSEATCRTTFTLEP